MGRTNVEQKLKGDIGHKNRHAALLRARLAEAAKYRRLAAETRNRRKSKQYAASADRLQAEIERLRACVLDCGRDLDKRIREEMKISEQEVADFQKRYEKELAEYRQAHADAKVKTEDHALAAVGWRHASQEERKKLTELQTVAAKARAQETKEQKDAAKVQKELDSEARDKAFFSLELKRIAVEQVAFRK
ncbi:MAG: hypothetical protein HYY17_07635 [Planctomycetes bacterium]|nr:hypothetical protein [Planctomycetota bacterium]